MKPTIDRLRDLPLFEGLGDDHLTALLAVAEVLDFAHDQVLFTEARPAQDWWVLLDGTIELSRHVGHEDTVVGSLSKPGQWAGGFRAWDPFGVYLGTGRGAVAGQVLRVSADHLRDLATAWFPFGVHLIKGLTQTVRTIESTARQRESLVALGTLAAGLAHEINNPASAATSAVDALEETTGALMSTLGRLAEHPITAAQFATLDAMRQEIPEPPVSMNALAVADREDELTQWLLDRDIEQDSVIAPPFAAAGFDTDWCERAAALLDGDALALGLEWVANSLSMASLLSEVKQSTRRISDLVGVVKSYSQMDRASMQNIPVAEGIESTLAVLAGKFDGGIVVERNFDAAVPLIEATAGELNQVWTHLIDNAVDAMAGTGRLRVSTRAERGSVVVEIADTGAGMTPEVRAHAFDPFFTTKDVGKGTGLGLDISRRIVVDRHGGEISIHQEPGETVLRVRLPLRSSRKA
jgi:signal transduction histidine kinase